ncbi:hypothetical protein V8G54_019693 [Vigna mungo]|uniref:Transposase MuDR plant domain-containing protein n=1 Tax=Vigna mungo TaxID=3915 RepID=A0AAQ3RU02_VIGMU
MRGFNEIEFGIQFGIKNPRGECITTLREVLSGDNICLIRTLELRDWSFDVNREVLQRVHEVVGVEFGGRVISRCRILLIVLSVMDDDIESKVLGNMDLRICDFLLDDRLEALCDDIGVMHMVTLARLNSQVHLYVVHIVSQLDVIHMIEYDVDERGDEVTPEVHEGGEGAQFGVGFDGERIKVVVGQAEIIEADDVDGDRKEIDEGDGERTKANQVEDKTDEVEGERIQVDEGHGEAERTEADEIEGLRIEVDESHGEAERTEADEVECERIQVEIGDGEAERTEAHNGEGDKLEVQDVEEVEDLEDIEVQVYEWSTSHDDDYGEVNSKDGLVNINVQCDFRESESSGNMEVELDMEEDEISDSNLTSPDISDDEEGYGNFATFRMPKNMLDFNWEVGTYFGQKENILDAIKSYAVENWKNIKFVKNDKKRIRVKFLGSKGECPWVPYFGFMDAVNSWQLRTVVDRHTCNREHKLRLFNAKWLTISKNMAYRMKAYASDEVEGSFTMQYTRIYDYAHELLARNPRSTIKVKVEENDGKPIFKRFYACLKACKDSFVSCRPIIGLDGAFLKGRHCGELLTVVVARYANDQMLPLAYAIVEVKNKETWTWFMELLIEDLGGPKVRLVIEGYNTLEGLVFLNTFTLVVKLTTVHLHLAIVASQHWLLK